MKTLILITIISLNCFAGQRSTELRCKEVMEYKTRLFDCGIVNGQTMYLRVRDPKIEKNKKQEQLLYSLLEGWAESGGYVVIDRGFMKVADEPISVSRFSNVTGNIETDSADKKSQKSYRESSLKLFGEIK